MGFYGFGLDLFMRLIEREGGREGGGKERSRKRREGVVFGFLYNKLRMRIMLCMQPDQ